MIAIDQAKNKKKLVEIARHEIENRILAGRLRPDHHLIEAELAGQLGISRTPLREALRQLEVKGLLKKRKSVGYTVVYHSLKDIRNTFEVRIALESAAIRLACKNATEEHIDRASYILSQFDEALATQGISHRWGNDFNSDRDWNSLFHKELYLASGNELLTTYIMNIRDLDRLKRIVLKLKLSDLLTFQAQHHKILEAVKQKNKGKAERAVQAHIKTLFNFYYRFAG